MTSMDRRLLPALAVSLVLHALPFASDLGKPQEVPKRQLITAHLQPPPPAGEPPPLLLPEPPQSAKPAKAEPPPRPPKPARPAPAPTAAPKDWTKEVKRQLEALDEQGRFYPEEAVSRGLEGQALVFFVLDERGGVVAARIEESSGHRILDDAALRAVRSLKSLPAAAPRETLLPVRFRLR